MSKSTALTRQSSDTDLMPPPPSKRIKRPPTVLSEESYTSRLSSIIARDYFPGLVESDAQQEYLEALDAGDEEWMEEAGQRVKQVMTPTTSRNAATATPRRFNLQALDGDWTPLHQTPIASSGKASKDLAQDLRDGQDTNMSLTKFLSKYTSEDSESFNKLVDKQNDLRREKSKWLWAGNKMPSKQRLAQKQIKDRQVGEQALTVPGFFSARNTGTEQDGDSKALVQTNDQQPSASFDDRPATVDAGKKQYNPRNAMFFVPEDLSETHPQMQSRAEIDQEASRAPPKAVNATGTRMDVGVEETAMEDEDTKSTYTGFSMKDDADSTGMTPRVKGYAFVDAEPTEAETQAARKKPDVKTLMPPPPREKVDHDALIKELVQSYDGENEESAGSNPFSIAESSKRETLHHAMVEKQSMAKRAKKDRLAALGHDVPATPKFMSSPRVGAMPRAGKTPRSGASLTPAARQLFGRMNMTPKSKTAGAGSSQRNFTPTPVGIRRPL